MARRLGSAMSVAVVFVTMAACSSIPDLDFEPALTDAGNNNDDGGGLPPQDAAPSQDATPSKDAAPSKDAKPPDDASPYNEGGSSACAANTPGMVLCCEDVPVACGGSRCNANFCANRCGKCKGSVLCCMGQNENQTECKGAGGTCS